MSFDDDSSIVIREAHIGKYSRIPDKSMRIDVSVVYSGRPLYPEIVQYCSVNKNPILYIPDSRILSGDIIKQIIHCIRKYNNLSIILCAERLQDVPRIFRYFLNPIYEEEYMYHTTFGEYIIHKNERCRNVVEYITELQDLGFISPEKSKEYLISLI